MQQEREKAISEEREKIARARASSVVEEEKRDLPVMADSQPSPVQSMFNS